jgi:integrase/recombinase XerD
MARKGQRRPLPGEAQPDSLAVWTCRFLEYLRVRNYSSQTVDDTDKTLRVFIEWAAERDIIRADAVTKPILESYQRWLFYYRKRSGKPLGHMSQRDRLQKVRNLFKWLSRQNAILSNPASDLELPRVEQRLPRAVLSVREMDKVLAQPDVSNPLGLRDRAMMEVFYSTGIRRHELTGLELFDINTDEGTVTVRLGKGKKDRLVPIGERALGWIARYLDEARAELVVSDAEHALFLSELGTRFHLGGLTNLMRKYIDAADVGKHGACHIFRHSMATHMLEGGADIRHIQEMLGHAHTSTTAIYTRVTIRHLKKIHEATHPAAMNAPRTEEHRELEHRKDSEKGSLQLELFSLLAAEAADESAAADDGVSHSPRSVRKVRSDPAPQSPDASRSARRGA